MPLHGYFVLGAFILLAIILAVRVTGKRGDGTGFIGRPSIDKYYFYSGKTALFTTWVFFIFKAIVPKLGYFTFPDYLCWIATGLLWIGAVAAAFAIIGLGGALKVGLPDTETVLQTRGVYRLSRNPLYTGIYLIAIASCLYFPDLINLYCTLYGIFIHHQIIKGEELFLSRRFGKEWENYSAKVRRYL